MRTSPAWRLLAATAALFVIACGTEPAAPVVEPNDGPDDAELLALQLSADFLEARDALGMAGAMGGGMMGGMDLMGTGIGTPLMIGAAGMAPMQPGTTMFVGMPRGMEIVRTVKFFDAKGVEQARFDTLLTARIETTEQVKGSGSFTLNGETRASTMEHARRTVVSGLEGKETRVTINSSGTMKVVTTATSPTKPALTTTVTGSDETKDLVVPVPRARGAYPLSGMVTHQHTLVAAVQGGATRTRSYKDVTTFNGTASVPVQVTVDGVTKSCTRSLETGRLACS